jgi:glycosyltransferase involved in cell wall biosynthesis
MTRTNAAAPAAPTSAAPAARPTIAIVTTCKGRLHHLKQTLPLMAAQQPDELIVVDYGCPDGAGDWVEANVPGAKVVRASSPDERFNVSRARNLGAAAATSTWLYFVDADVMLSTGLVEMLRGGLRPGHYFRPVPQRGAVGAQIYGTFVCLAADFARIGGYDEVIEGWGREDKDLYLRLSFGGVRESRYDPGTLAVIDHGDAERHVIEGMRHRWHNEAVNAAYSEAKLRISQARGGTGDMRLDERRKLLAACRKAVDAWYEGGASKPLAMRFFAGGYPTSALASRMTLRAERWITLVLEPAGRAHGDQGEAGETGA